MGVGPLAVLPPRAELGWFPTRQGAVFGGLYRGQAPAPRALLACHTFGADRMASHRAYRRLGELSASHAVPALWIDYPGTSDSDGYPRDRPQFACYLEALHDACEFLRARTGARVITTFGFDLGGALAYQLAVERPDVDSCVVHAPALNGRRWLRQQVAVAALGTSNPLGLRCSRHREGDEEISGYVWHAGSLEGIRAVDLQGVAPEGVKKMWVIPRSRTSGESRWVESLRAAGVDVSFDPEPPVHVEHDLLYPGTRPPEKLLDGIATWVAKLPVDAPPTLEEVPAPVTAGAPASELSAVAEVHAPDGTVVCEQFVRFAGDKLCAIASEPLESRGIEELPVVILVNSGHNHRPGINRNYTEWARTWAARGLRVLRIDYRGLGDADPVPLDALRKNLEPKLQGLYLPRTTRDLAKVVDFTEQRWGHRRAVLMGLCAGAFEALQLALRDERVCAVLAINMLRLTREPPPRVLVNAFKSWEHWKSYTTEPQSLFRDLRDLARQGGRRAGARLGMYGRGGNWFAAEVRSLVDRGKHVCLVFDESEPMRGFVNRLLAPDLEKLTRSGRYTVEVIPASNHIISPLHSQEKLGKVLDRFVGAFLESGARR